MPVPELPLHNIPCRRRNWRSAGILAGVALAVCGLAAQAGAAKRPAPSGARQGRQWVQISLGSLGFPGVSETFLQAGSSMLTVHLLDDSHLLVSFSLRDLVPRVAGDPTTDEDRMVAAEIVELPSGKIDARTVWHMHDHGRYLWSLGDGRFLVRIGDRLSTMTPLANLATADPFQRTALPGQEYSPSAVFVSPDGRLITLESVVSYVNPDGRAAVLLGDADADKPVTRTIVRFFRVEPEESAKAGAPASSLRIIPAGGLTLPQPVLLPLDSDGYLGAEETGRDLWSVSFNEFGGKTIKLGNLQSSCFPRLQMVSRAEFVAFPCRGSDDNVKIASYGLDGHETWEEGLGEMGSPAFAFAPAAARFAVSHATLAVPPLANVPGASAGAPARQEVRVYQNASGDLLLRVECSPVFKSAENFDLSADGLLASVVRDGAVVVYKLPPPDKADLQDMAEVAKFAPSPSPGPIDLDALMKPAEPVKQPGEGDRAATSAGVAPAPATSAAAGPASAGAAAAPPPAVAMAQSAAPSAASARGMAASVAAEPIAVNPSTGIRKRPTLLNPGEKPEFGSSNAEGPD